MAPSPTLPPFHVCERARIARDPRFDGLFYIAVRSTGIYCRPVCPAIVSRPENILYYPTAAAASAAGYRPCLRCRPELSPETRTGNGESVVQRALDLIADGFLQDDSVEALARRVGITARHLRRLFLAHVGATPNTVHATRRLLLAKQLLTETSLPVTQVALAAGFNSVRRFNSAFLDGCGMPPSRIRRQRVRGAADDVLLLRLAYRPPLDFPAMLAFLARRAIPGVERVTDDGYERVLGPADAPSWIRVRADARRPELRLEIAGADPRAIQDIVRRVRAMFDLDANLRAVHAVFLCDTLLQRAVSRRPGLRVPVCWDGFELAVRAILGQQVSVAGATTLVRRLVDDYGTPVSTRHMPPGRPGLDRLFPDPARLTDAPLETIGLPRSRAASIRALARATLDGRIAFTRGQRLEDFIERCTALPGIGAWTAHYIAMRALGQPDAFPAGDLILQQVISGDGTGTGLRASEREAEARSQAWRPWRAYAVLHLWHLAADIARERKAA